MNNETSLTSKEFLADVAAVYIAGATASRFGSGRLIAPGLVLTAGHVVDYPTREAPTRTGWSVRLLRNRKPDGTWVCSPHSADVVWRGAGNLDLALIHLSDTTPVTPSLKTAIVDFTLIGEKDVLAAGFPRAMWTADGALGEYIVYGKLRIAQELGPYIWTVSYADKPNKVHGWHGISGAVVCFIGPNDNLELLGVVEDVPTTFNGGQLTVARLFQGRNDADFLDCLTKALKTNPKPLERFALPIGNDVPPSITNASAGNFEKIRYPIYKGDEGVTLEDCINNNNIFSLEDLLRHGYEANPSNKYSKTPLHLAAAAGNLDAVRILIAYNADIDFPEEDGSTPLVYAMKNRSVDIVRELVSSGADIKSCYSGIYGMTPLHWAAEYGDADLVRMMISKGADVNSHNYEFGTPIMRAVKGNRLDIVNTLIECDAEITAFSHNKNWITPLHEASEKGSIDIVCAIIAAGAIIDETTYPKPPYYLGNTALYLASLSGHAEICQALLEHGANVNVKCYAGYTPAHAAAFRGHLDVLKILIKSGADIHARSKDNETLLDVAHKEQQRNIVRFLKSSNSFR